MPLSSDLVGATTTGFTSSIDHRWAMNFAAGIDDVSPVLYDTTSAKFPVHPMYLGYPEWEASKLAAAMLKLPPEEQGRGVQVSHDTRIHQPFRVGLDLITTAEIAGVHRHRAGALQTVKLETRTTDGDLIATTLTSAIQRGVAVDGDDRPPISEQRPEPPANMESSETIELFVPANACHTYSECARIYNAFHTDLSVAKAVGIDGLILHGTGTIARAVSAITAALTGGNPSSISRIAADLKGMVMVPTALTLSYRSFSGPDELPCVAFEVLNARGERAIAAGLIEMAN